MKITKIYILLISCCLMLSCSKVEQPHYSGLYEEIRYINKMEFAQMSVTKTVKTERSDWYKLGKRIAVYSYDTYLKAFIDLSKLQPEDLEFNDNDKIVRITLPAVEVEITGRDMTMKKEYENIGYFRTNIDSKERAEMKEKANSELKKELEGNPEYKQKLVETARRKARSYFETLLKDSGYKTIVRFNDEIPTGSDYQLQNYD